MSAPQIISQVREMQQAVEQSARAGNRVGFVPTMGALHEGHLSLVDASRQICDTHVVSIFVNPTQFGEGEDLERYPRTFDADVAMLTQRNVDFVFVPSNEAMYPAGYSTYVEPPDVARSLEGKCRPGHFRGVATVVLKLFHAVPADVAFFGEKDFQQSLVIRHMVRDLNLPIEIESCPIIRDSDGLALSSRNRYLSSQERSRALSIPQALTRAKKEFEAGNRDAHALERVMIECLDSQVDKIDYAVVVDADTLKPFDNLIDRPAVALIAAHVGTTRLIDNQRIG